MTTRNETKWDYFFIGFLYGAAFVCLLIAFIPPPTSISGKEQVLTDYYKCFKECMAVCECERTSLEFSSPILCECHTPYKCQQVCLSGRAYKDIEGEEDATIEMEPIFSLPLIERHVHSEHSINKENNGVLE